ncbi:hypothetical protein AQUCO_03700129v1 [Aquilegia coerulea]|uniref:F-box domain-containing protein n=1 Tax=Aquilegia coerulea TaxID=218851 RepID=A0A2G5CTL6_AQUCA|nr:hypothetical protein AQUCO_03700129v1 [Aquilegia coerulea]
MEEEKLPMEVMMEILSRLPVKSLSRFRCVSKTWLKLFTCDDPYFSKLNANHNANYNPTHPGILFTDLKFGVFYVADYNVIDKAERLPFQTSTLNDYKIVAICNGLVCFRDSYLNVYIWNPIIQDHITIPCSPLPSHFTTSNNTLFGFGFHQGTNEYKVIRIVWSCEKNSEGFQSHVSVYTLGTNSTWRILPDYLSGMKYAYEPSVLVTGALHWIAARTLGSCVIVSFDMEHEFFKEIPQPTGIEYKYARIVRVGNMGGYLSLSYSIHKGNVHIWQMKEYGVVESWTQQYVIGQTEIPGSLSWLFLVGTVNDGEIIIMKSLKEFILYNPKNHSIRNLHTSEFTLKNAYTYIGSLVSPTVIDKKTFKTEEGGS